MTEYDEYVDFIIYGDGITSDVLSLVLKNAGKQFYVLGDDKVDQSAESPRSLALSPSSMNLLEFFGINFPVEKLNKMKVYESDLSNDKIKSELIFDNGKTLSYVTKYYDLKKSLLQETKAHKRKIESKNFSSIELDKDYIKLIIEGGKIIYSKNIIFTQKIETILHSQLNLSYIEKSYNQKAIVATLKHSTPHGGIAYQFYDNGKPLALLPLSKENNFYRSSLIWSLDDYLADDILLNEDLNDILNLKLGHLYENIEISEGAISFELDKFLLKGKPDNRLIFIGDSVRMMHPMAGQAWNQALRDISYIADALFESKNLGIDLISTPSFNAFTRIRKFEGEGMTNSIDLINYIYTLDSSISKGFRRNMMKLINTIKPVNKLFISEAEGGILRRPSLLMGESPGSNKI